jgi:hypothetical protein
MKVQGMFTRDLEKKKKVIGKNKEANKLSYK